VTSLTKTADRYLLLSGCSIEAVAESHRIGKEGEGRWMKNRNLLKHERSAYKSCSFRAPRLKNLKMAKWKGASQDG